MANESVKLRTIDLLNGDKNIFTTLFQIRESSNFQILKT